MITWLDVETGDIITREQLEKEFIALQAEQPAEYNYTFSDYIRNCESKNGTLIRIYNVEKK